ncbi:unnamed protein product [Closterium sp. Naga37s-1]|nr:unnamed protein product [Closterium sp. Naga37s-1]
MKLLTEGGTAGSLLHEKKAGDQGYQGEQEEKEEEKEEAEEREEEQREKVIKQGEMEETRGSKAGGVTRTRMGRDCACMGKEEHDGPCGNLWVTKAPGPTSSHWLSSSSQPAGLPSVGSA